jgi:hypothetical protein
MEATPEEVLARLQRYADSMKQREQFAPASPGVARTASAVSATAEPRRVEAPVITEDPPDFRYSFNTLRRTIAGQVICVATCVATILLWINVSHLVTYILVLNVAALFGVCLARRIPFAGWVLIGLALGLVLGRFS